MKFWKRRTTRNWLIFIAFPPVSLSLVQIFVFVVIGNWFAIIENTGKIVKYHAEIKIYRDIAVSSIIESDPRMSTRTLASFLNMFKMSVNQILTQELKMKLVGSSFVHTRANMTFTPVGWGEPKETSRFRLQVLRESDHYQRIVNSLLQTQTQTWKWDLAVNRVAKTHQKVWQRRFNWWHFSTVGGWFINTSVLPGKELIANTTQQSSSSCECTSAENARSWLAIRSFIRITHLPIRHF